jgi:hypothetical protein
MSITNYLLEKDRTLELKPEVGKSGYVGNKVYQMFNDGGVEVEVGEFLYGLVRMLKPEVMLETGTHHGISACYIGQAMKDNQFGQLITLEFSAECCQIADKRFEKIGLTNHVKLFKEDSLTYQPTGAIDMLLLDTEPDIRFKEFDKYFKWLAEGGLTLIHDLNVSLGYNRIKMHGMEHWPFGSFKPYLGGLLLQHKLQVFNMFTPRGLTILQKSHPDFMSTKFMKGEL